ncbi:bck1-like resistance to osmotic shock [Podochytrium sp. JEL0797]|nr:bck1-like resistance to osmotic shock [Podochytrium sp. JEL0797]
MAQSPLLFPPTKKTEEVDFGPSFRAYIASAYGDDPDKFASEIGLLGRLRDDTRGAGKDLTGRDILYRYYGQLELLDLRFPIDDKHVKVLFTWYDAFTGKSVAQNAIAYEKACVIFALAATCGAIAASQDRNDPHALKLAFNHLQTAAGLFAYINDNFLHPPSVDLSRESVKALETLMLAQAQELFIEKCIVENKQGGLVAKLCAQAALLYLNAKDALCDDALKQQINRAWIDIVKIKQNYFESLAHYHRSIQLEADAKYGHVVSHMMKSETCAKDAESLAKYFSRTYPSFTVSATNGQNSSLAILSSLSGGNISTGNGAASPATALAEMTRALALRVTDRKNSAIKDNDVIYHESTPSVDSLAAIDKLAAAKPTTFAELCPQGAADVVKIVGPDIFAKLVPLSVHTAASVYSEEQAKLLRCESGAVESADEEMKATLESMGIVGALDKLKRVLKGGSSGVQDVMASDEALGLTEEVRGFCETIRAQEIGRGTGTDELLGVVEGLKGKIKGTLDEIGLMLDKEQHECESMRVKFMNSWNQEPSVKLTAQIRHDIRSHRESFDKALATDQGLLARLNECRRDVATMSRPLEEVQSIFAELIRAVATLKKSDVAVGNLIDEVPGSTEGLGKLGEQIIVEKLDGMIQQLRKLKTERASTLAELKTKVHDDDISKALLVNKNKESQVFQAELAKFKPFQTKLGTNISTHTQLLIDISTEYEKLKTASTTLKVLELRERKRNEIAKEWKASFNLWKEAKDGLNRGVRFYTDLSDLAMSLRNTVVGFVNRRAEESAALLKKVEAEEAMKGQRTLQNEMARMSVNSNGPPQQQSQAYHGGGYSSSPTTTSPVTGSTMRSASFPPPPQVQQPQQPQPPQQAYQAYGAPPASAQSPYQTAPPLQATPAPGYGGAPPPSTYGQQPPQNQYRPPAPQQPVYGGAPAPHQQQQQPVYGGAPPPRPAAPAPAPVYGGQPGYAGYNQPAPNQPPQNQYQQARPPAPYYPATPQQPYGAAPPTPQQQQQQRPPAPGAAYGGYPQHPQPGPPAVPQKQYGGQLPPAPAPAPVQPQNPYYAQQPPAQQQQQQQQQRPYGQAPPPPLQQYQQQPPPHGYAAQQPPAQQQQQYAPQGYAQQQPPVQQYAPQQQQQYAPQQQQYAPQQYGAAAPQGYPQQQQQQQQQQGYPAPFGMGQQVPPQGPPQQAPYGQQQGRNSLI